jgi:hypothetical protein
MISEREHSDPPRPVVGELSKRLASTPLRILTIVTGFILIRGLLALAARYLLALKRYASIKAESACLVVESKWSILGKPFFESKTEAPIKTIQAVRLENRQRYLHLLVGFGALTTGTWIGLQLLVDGLRASYPYLALIGAGIVVAGVLIDLALYIFVPSGPHRAKLILAMGPWQMRISGVDAQAAEELMRAVRLHFDTTTAAR